VAGRLTHPNFSSLHVEERVPWGGRLPETRARADREGGNIKRGRWVSEGAILPFRVIFDRQKEGGRGKTKRARSKGLPVSEETGD